MNKLLQYLKSNYKYLILKEHKMGVIEKYAFTSYSFCWTTVFDSSINYVTHIMRSFATLSSHHIFHVVKQACQTQNTVRAAEDVLKLKKVVCGPHLEKF